MTKLMADLFRSLFATVVAVLLAGCAALGWRVYADGGSLAGAAAAVAVSVAGVVLVSGAIALQIENNRHLRRIAETLERGGTAGRHGGPGSAPGGRVEPVLRR